MPTGYGAVALRRARALIGWMRPDLATLAQGGQNRGEAAKPKYARLAAAARAAVLARPVGLDQIGAVRPAPDVLGEHISALRSNPGAAEYFKEGNEVRVVDLRRIRAAQPVVRAMLDAEVAPKANDLIAIARHSLPVKEFAALPAQFDPTKNAWLFGSTDPNLRIIGNFAGPVGDGVQGFGFMVRIQPSFMQIAEYRGKYLMRDGYTRACWFLENGISIIPAFVRKYESFEEIGLPAGMLPQDEYLGDRPPTIADYFESSVSAEIQTPEQMKVVVLQALEFSMLS
jgi:hypothetical protein